MVTLFCSRPWSMRSVPVPSSAIMAAQDDQAAVVRRRAITWSVTSSQIVAWLPT